MSEHNVSKPRTCKTCNQVIVGTAKELKEHAAKHDIRDYFSAVRKVSKFSAGATGLAVRRVPGLVMAPAAFCDEVKKSA